MEECTKPLLCDANYDCENKDFTNTLRLRRFKQCDVSTNFIWYCSMRPTLSTCQIFSQVLPVQVLLTMFWATTKYMYNVDRWITRMISRSTSITPLKRERWPIIFIVFFERVLGREHSGKVSKKFIGNFYFWGITIIIIRFVYMHMLWLCIQ